MRAVFVVVLSLAWLEGVGAALACGYPTPDAFVIQGDEHDTQAPAAPSVAVQRVKRGREPKQDGCQQEATSCDDIGYVLLDVGATAAEPSAELGYVLEVKGKSPADLERYQRGPLSLLSYEPGQLRLVWTDGEGRASYDFDIYVWSVDRAGNLSETPSLVHVETSGADGCAAGAASHGGGWLLLLLGLWVLHRRSTLVA